MLAGQILKWSSWTVVHLAGADKKGDGKPLDTYPRHRNGMSLTMNVLSRALFLLVIFAQAAPAQVTVDVSKITCEQFNVLPKADSVAVWLSGYYHGQRRDSVIDMNKFEDNVRNIRAMCRIADNFKRPVIELVESNMPK